MQWNNTKIHDKVENNQFNVAQVRPTWQNYHAAVNPNTGRNMNTTTPLTSHHIAYQFATNHTTKEKWRDRTKTG